MFYCKENPVLKNELLVYCDNRIVATINKANFETDRECEEFALFMIQAMNEKNTQL